ncbi:helix-turn-helix domain-containing protein [Lysinibacillus sp. LZ02]|uniref:helix-turn-helix domain-containing protein n=1 Tax=Lysinibacillus sp. LZ02 TaxID=3420668 RepID=UPI003D35D5F4
MQDLGSRIRHLRKERKLTLAQLAGERLTKGMLSLIENGKAQPSMESLHYIAQQLQVDVSALLGEEIESFKELMLEVEEMRVQLNDHPDDKVRAQIIIDKINPIVNKLQTDRYEHIRLKEIYLISLTLINNKLDEQALYDVMNWYEGVHAYSRLLSCYNFLCWYAFERKDYEKALDMLKQGEKRIEPYWFILDDISRISLFYNLTVMYYAVNDVKNGLLYKEKMLQIAEKKKIYYRMDDFYRLLFIQAICDHEFEVSKQYFKKVQLMTELAEDNEKAFYYLFCKVHYISVVEKNYEQVLIILNEEIYSQQDVSIHETKDLFLMEEAIALYHLEKYEQALAICEGIKAPNYLKHPVDLAIFYRFVAYRALMYKKLGDIESAKRDILYAEKSVESFASTYYTDFIRQTYEEIMT